MASPKFSLSATRRRSQTAVSNSDSENSHGDQRPMLPFRHSSSWLCCKFWKRTPIDESERSASSSNSNATSLDRHRCQTFLKASRFVDDLTRRRTPSRVEEVLEESSPILSATASEGEVKRLIDVITMLMERVANQPDTPAIGDEECLTCTTNRASMQTFPCGHKVLCKTCFLTTIKVALQERQLPLRCVVCRSRVVRLKPQSATCPVVVRKQSESPGSFFLPHTLSPLPPSGTRHPGYM